MSYRRNRPMWAGLLSLCALSAAASWVPAEVPDAAWNAPGTYYSNLNDAGGVMLQGTALQTRLRTIISTGFNDVSYDAEKVTMPVTDRVYGTAASAKQMWGCYDRKLLTGVWDSAATWNREHVWPQSKLNGVSDHDMFGLRPAYVQSNGDRANYGYGGYAITDFTTAAGNLPKATGATSPLFYAGAYDRGDTARACFYMATRYTALKIVATNDGANSVAGQLGDLNSMLRANYRDPVDNFERRRNQLIYKNTELTSSSYSQGNRNPYVDHPEWVWSVFGDGANDSQITVGTATGGGASQQNVSFGRVIVGGSAPTLSTTVAINKTGTDPTTFAVATSGAATAGTADNPAVFDYNTVTAGNLNTFDYNAGSKSMTVGLTGVTTSTAGLKSGTVTVDNTDITNGGSGTGALDGNDSVNLSLSVLDHSNASFSAAGDVDTLVLNFDTDKVTTKSLGFSLTNLLSTVGYTAGLDLNSITGTGDTGAFDLNLAAFSALTGGASNAYTATFDPTHAGAYYAVYTLGVSDENLSGATIGNSLTLILAGSAGGVNNSVPEPAMLVFAPMASLLLRRRRAS